MTRLFYGCVAIGVVVIIAVAAFFPLPQNQRYRSSIDVIPDGGRQESFTMRWPQDRLQPLATGGGVLVLAGGAAILPASNTAGASAEIFRLRDMAGNVIGLASRSTSMRGAKGGSATQGSDWIILIPSRGALFMTQTNGRDVAPRATPGSGFVPAADDAAFWVSDKRVRISAGPLAQGAGQVMGGTGEFEGLRGSYDETWELEEVVGGGTRGRITLETRVQATL